MDLSTIKRREEEMVFAFYSEHFSFHEQKRKRKKQKGQPEHVFECNFSLFRDECP